MFDGEWIPQVARFGGAEIEVPPGVMRLAGGRYVIEREAGPKDEGRWEARPEAGAEAFDVVGETGAAAGTVLRALIRRRGDLLQLCYYAEPGAERPTGFASEAGTLAVLVRYRRG